MASAVKTANKRTYQQDKFLLEYFKSSTTQYNDRVETTCNRLFFCIIGNFSEITYDTKRCASMHTLLQRKSVAKMRRKSGARMCFAHSLFTIQNRIIKKTENNAK